MMSGETPFTTLTCVAVAIFASACLPSDDRPPPGSVTFTVSPSPAVRDGVTTDDGWTLTFARLLLGIGRTGLDDGCTEYAEARYDRLLDVAKGSRQKLSIIYGLGQCDVRFRIATPSPDALLGVGISQADRLTMGTFGKDAYADDTVAVLIEGRALRGGFEERFNWRFRKSFRYSECRPPGDAGSTVLPIDLEANKSTIKDIVIDGEAFFRDRLTTGARIRFSPFAAADLSFGNADGVVDLDELAKVPLPVAVRVADSDAGQPFVGADASDASADETRVRADSSDGSVDASGPYVFSEGGTFTSADGSVERVETLRDFVYVLLLPTLPRLAGTERCAVIGPSFR